MSILCISSKERRSSHILCKECKECLFSVRNWGVAIFSACFFSSYARAATKLKCEIYFDIFNGDGPRNNNFWYYQYLLMTRTILHSDAFKQKTYISYTCGLTLKKVELIKPATRKAAIIHCTCWCDMPWFIVRFKIRILRSAPTTWNCYSIKVRRLRHDREHAYF